jgi:hypothetical protein
MMRIWRLRLQALALAFGSFLCLVIIALAVSKLWELAMTALDWNP